MPLSELNEESASTVGQQPPPGAALTRRQCKWCLRFSDLPNPVVAARASKPSLPWRRRAGRECAHCPWVLAAYQEYAASDKEGLLAQFNDESKPARETFLARLDKWEAEKNTNPQGKFKEGDRAKSSSGTARKVTAASRTALETKEVLGWFWPEKLWKKHNPGKKIAKKDVTWITHQGKSLKGTLLEESAGKPQGVIEVSSTGMIACAKEAELAASDSELDDDVDKVFESAQKRLRTSAAPVAKSEVGSLKLSSKAPAPENIAPGESPLNCGLIMRLCRTSPREKL